jgi:Tfp pilus assembly protein PilN
MQIKGNTVSSVDPRNGSVEELAAWPRSSIASLQYLLQRERRARNTFAMLAFVGWVVALALLGQGGAV